MMKCSIIIPVYNNANFTKSALDDLSRLAEGHEVIIVDNASTDHTIDVLKDYDVIHIRNEANEGFASANNTGYTAVAGEYVLFMNNDIRVQSNHESWLDEMIEQCGDDIIGTQSGMIDRDYNFVKEGAFDPMQKGAYLSGWCMLAKRSTWDKLILDGDLGPWNEKFFLYFEDDDLSWRAKQAGIKLRIVEIPVHHFSRTTGRKYNMFHFFKKSRRIFKKIWKGKLV